VCVCVCVRLCATIYLGKSSLLLILTDFETAEGVYMYIYLYIYTHAYMYVKYYAISSCMLEVNIDRCKYIQMHAVYMFSNFKCTHTHIYA